MLEFWSHGLIMALSKISHRNPITQFQLNCTILLLFTMAFNNVFLSFFVSDCCDMMYSYLPHAGKNKHASTISLQAGSGRQAVGQQAAGPRTGIHHFFFYSGRNHTGDSLFKVPAVVFCSFSSACCSSWSMSVMRFFSSLPRSPSKR